MVEYLVIVRDGDMKNIGYVLTGFYGGAFLGRLALAEPTYRFGERRMIFIYAVLCVGLQLVFWLYGLAGPDPMLVFPRQLIWHRVPEIVTAAVAVSFMGFFSGPFFATVGWPPSSFPPSLGLRAINRVIRQGINVGSRICAPEIRSSAIGKALGVFPMIDDRFRIH